VICDFCVRCYVIDDLCAVCCDGLLPWRLMRSSN
jgi:hypothetical protein